LVVFGVDGEDPAWADDDQVDVRAVAAHGDRVDEPPARVAFDESREFLGDEAFSDGASLPG